MSTSTNSGDPRDVIAYLLKHTHLRLTELTDTALAPLGIDSKDFGLLRVIAAGEPKSQAYVAQSLSIDRTTMVALVDTLEAKDVVRRRPDPEDRRRNVVELTASGRGTFAKACKAYDAAEGELLASLGRTRTEGLRDALRAVIDSGAQD